MSKTTKVWDAKRPGLKIEAKRLRGNVLWGKRLVTAKITENISNGRFLTVDTLQ